MATWWICKGRPLLVRPLPLPPPQPQRGDSPRPSRTSPRAQAQPLARAQGASWAPSPAWWRALRWPRMLPPLHTLSRRQQQLLLKEPLLEAVSQPSLSYANPRSCWWLMISTQTGEWTFYGVSMCAKTEYFHISGHFPPLRICLQVFPSPTDNGLICEF